MQITEFRTKMAEALTKLREASTDEDRQAAEQAIETLQQEAGKIEAAAPPPDSIEALTEAAPQLVKDLRESAAREAAQDATELRKQYDDQGKKLAEAEKLISGITNVTRLAEAVRSAGVEDEVEVRHYIGQAQQRGLAEPEDIKAMVEADRAFTQRQTDVMVAKVREAIGEEFPEVDGIFTRAPEGGEEAATATVETQLRESGIPLKETAAA